jgi:hypothetical protein
MFLPSGGGNIHPHKIYPQLILSERRIFVMMISRGKEGHHEGGAAFDEEVFESGVSL